MQARHALIAVFLLAGATAASAQTTSNAADPGRAPAAADAEKKICVREVPTGSSLARTQCHTKKEWDEIQRDRDDAQSAGSSAVQVDRHH